MNKKFETCVTRNIVLEVKLTTDEWRAERCIGEIKTLHLDRLFIRDVLAKDHEPFVYWTNGVITYSHERKGDVVRIYQETYGMRECI